MSRQTITRRHSVSAARRWWFPADPLTWLVGLAALAVYSSHGFGGFLSRDLAVYAYGGQQVADGVPPYVGILTRAGPLGQLLPGLGAAGARLIGIEDLLGMRLLYLVISVACVCLVYLVARGLFASRFAGVAAAAAFLSFHGFIEYASNGPREKTAMVLFLLCALLAIVKHRWFAAGFCVSLATLTWQPAFFVGMIAMIVALAGIRRAECLRALLRIVVGGAVPALACLLYFTIVGALEEFIEAFLLLNLKYTQQPEFLHDPEAHWAGMTSGFGASVWVLVGGLVSLYLLTLLTLSRKYRHTLPAPTAVVAFGAAGIGALVWTLRNFDNWPDAFVFLPLAAIGVGGLVRLVTLRLRPGVSVCVTLAWVLVAGTTALTYSISERDHRLQQQRASVSRVLDQVGHDSTILSIWAPHPLVLSGKTNPTRFQMFGTLEEYINDSRAGGIQGYADWIGRTEPEIIAIGPYKPPTWVAKTLKREYEEIGRAPGWTWFVHESVGWSD